MSTETMIVPPEIPGPAEKITATLETVRAEGRSALIGYLPAGFPSIDGAVRAAVAMVEGGCDVIEVGLPHSDPVLDGPAIQNADAIALRAGLRTTDVLRTVGRVHAATGVPVLCMSYWNPIDAYGPERFAADLAAAGGAGCILPDLPVEVSEPWRTAAARYGLATVFLVAPSNSDARLSTITAAGSGFVYAASLLGVTGVRAAIGTAAEDLVRRLRERTTLPVCVGLGVSNRAQAAQVAQFADGVIVGSAFVERLLAEPDLDAGVEAVRTLASELARGVRSRT